MPKIKRNQRILLVGNGNPYHIGAFFKRALDNLRYEYRFVDEGMYLGALENSLPQKILFRALRRPATFWSLNHKILQVARSFKPQILLVVKGSYVSPKVLAQIKTKTRPVLVNYATDDPFSKTNSTRFLISAIQYYDLYCSTKRAMMRDLHQAGCPNIEYVRFAYEPSLHFPETPENFEEAKQWTGAVTFAGGCDEDRASFFSRVAQDKPDLDLRLYGGYWDNYGDLRKYWRGFARGRDYRIALSLSTISACLVRRANRDGHTMRTFEIPACGGFPLTERTEEHLEFFEEGKEMAYFDSPEEFLDKVQYYSNHEREREQISSACYQKVITGRNTYQDRLIQVLEAANRLL